MYVYIDAPRVLGVLYMYVCMIYACTMYVCMYVCTQFGALFGAPIDCAPKPPYDAVYTYGCYLGILKETKTT